MGTLYRASYTIDLPENAIVKDGIARWSSKGVKKSGKLTSNQKGERRVLVETDIWVAKYKDENGKTRTISTKTSSKQAALRILHELENDKESHATHQEAKRSRGTKKRTPIADRGRTEEAFSDGQRKETSAQKTASGNRARLSPTCWNGTPLNGTELDRLNTI